MRSDLKKQHVRKEINRHQTPVAMTQKHQHHQEPAGDPTALNAPGDSKAPAPQIKGKDIDLMNYTDL